MRCGGGGGSSVQVRFMSGLGIGGPQIGSWGLIDYWDK